jgi:hypothetical protein
MMRIALFASLLLNGFTLGVLAWTFAERSGEKVTSEKPAHTAFSGPTVTTSGKGFVSAQNPQDLPAGLSSRPLSNSAPDTGGNNDVAPARQNFATAELPVSTTAPISKSHALPTGRSTSNAPASTVSGSSSAAQTIIQPMAINSLSGTPPATNDATVIEAPPSAVIPASLATPLDTLTPEQANAANALAQDFVDNVAGSPQPQASPSSSPQQNASHSTAWQNAQTLNDQRYKLLFGSQAYVQQQIKAQQETNANSQ